MMASHGRKQCCLVLLCTALLLENLVIPVMSSATFEDQRKRCSPDPNARTPPTPTVRRAPPRSGGGYGSPTPPRGTPSGGRGSPTPPSSGGGTTPSNCGNPPPSGGLQPVSPSSPGQGGGPGGGGGPGRGYYSPPSYPTAPSTPLTPTVVSPPLVPSPPPPTFGPGTPSIPGISTPIFGPGTPSTPGITVPSPLFPFDPNSLPFPWNYWSTHPTLIWGLFGWMGVGGAFGVPSLPGLGSTASLLDALRNSRTDALGELYREGTAALLNSMVHSRFTYTTRQVRDSFAAAIGSNKAAAVQARLFKLANEGRSNIRA